MALYQESEYKNEFSKSVKGILFKVKKITIIGAESFLARNFIQYMLMNGYADDVVIFLYGREKETKNKIGEYHQIDFSDKEEIGKIEMDVDTIFIFSGLTGTVKGFFEYENFIYVNETILLHILDAYKRKKSSARIVYPTSRLVLKSKEDELLNECADIELKSIYAVNKYAAEQYLKIYKECFGIKYVLLRICTPIGTLIDGFGTYGTFEIFKNQAISDGRITIYGDGCQRKTFTHILDICEAFFLLAFASEIKYDVYHLGGQSKRLRDIVENIAGEYHVPIVSLEWPELDKKVDGGTVVLDSLRFDSEFNFSYRENLL